MDAPRKTPRQRAREAVRRDPVRAYIVARAAEKKLRLRNLGVLCGRWSEYFTRYINDGTPAVLTAEDRRRLAEVLDCPETNLCAPGQTPSVPLTPPEMPVPFPRPAPEAPAPSEASDLAVVTAPPPTATPQMVLSQALSVPPMAEGDALSYVAAPIDVPIYRESATIGPATEAGWSPRPSNLPWLCGTIAFEVERGCARTRPGDTVFAIHRRPRPGDLTVCLQHDRVAAIGEVIALSPTRARVSLGEAGHVDFDLPSVNMLKVVTVVTA